MAITRSEAWTSITTRNTAIIDTTTTNDGNKIKRMAPWMKRKDAWLHVPWKSRGPRKKVEDIAIEIRGTTLPNEEQANDRVNVPYKSREPRNSLIGDIARGVNVIRKTSTPSESPNEPTRHLLGDTPDPLTRNITTNPKAITIML